MIKRLLILLVSILPFCVSAQTGRWKVYPTFGEATALLETPHYVYYVSGGSLHARDKDNDETRSFQPGLDISRGQVNDIFYNKEGKYLLVTFTDGNIDLIYDDGQRMNLPDIRDAKISMTKGINDVAFDKNLIYVACSFGLVIFDEDKGSVKESAIFNYGISSVATDKNFLYVTPIGGEYESRIMKIEKGKRINNINYFSLLGYVPAWASNLYTLPSDGSSNVYLAELGVNGQLYIFELGNETNVSGPYFTSVKSITPTSDGLIVAADGALHHVAAPAKITQLATLPSEIASDMITSLNGAKSVWAANVKGLGHYSIADNGSLTVLSDRYRNPESTTFSEICRLYPLPDGKGFIATNQGVSARYAVGNGNFLDVIFKGNIIREGKVENIEINDNVTIKSSPGISNANNLGNHIFSTTFAIQDIDDESKFYIGSGTEGVYVIKDGQEIGLFSENSKIPKMLDWIWSVNSAKIDKLGNLIVGVYTIDPTKPALVVLPNNKRQQNPSTIKKEDWVALNTGPQIQLRDVDFLLSENAPIIFVKDASYYVGFTAIHYGSSIIDPSDDKVVVVGNYIDQDGKAFSPDYITCFAEDKNGRVWVGTDIGIFEITNPLQVFSSDFRITRLKVPRNDGTNLADYLLDNEEIRCIGVDSSNRKWIGTKHSGLYLVNENGTEILEHFTTENSPLGFNEISDLYVDPNSNSVFVSTLAGLCEYSSDSSPAAADYSNVYAYPNPVEPGYTGWITITGLMDSSRVKIMDSSMNLIYETVSEGGMALWDGCTMNGSRVKSGVYYVLASTSSDMNSQGKVVAKILVIN